MEKTTRRTLLAGAGAFALSPPAQAQGWRVEGNTFKHPTIIVTGDMGTVGRRLVPLLAGRYTIIGVDKKRGPIEDLSILPFAGIKAEAVVHLAWDTSVHDDAKGALYNSWITAMALEATRAVSAKKFVFASSAWADPDLYGRKRGNEPTRHYTDSKQFLEDIVRRYGEARDIETASVRFGLVNPTREDQHNDPSFDPRVRMTDDDLRGLLEIALRPGSRIVGPYDARP